jgi:hypothetical protein
MAGEKSQSEVGSVSFGVVADTSQFSAALDAAKAKAEEFKGEVTIVGEDMAKVWAESSSTMVTVGENMSQTFTAVEKGAKDAGKAVEETGKVVEETGKKVDEAGRIGQDASQKVDKSVRRTTWEFRSMLTSVTATIAAMYTFFNLGTRISSVIGGLAREQREYNKAVEEGQRILERYNAEREKATKISEGMVQQNIDRINADIARLTEEEYAAQTDAGMSMTGKGFRSVRDFINRTPGGGRVFAPLMPEAMQLLGDIFDKEYKTPEERANIRRDIELSTGQLRGLREQQQQRTGFRTLEELKRHAEVQRKQQELLEQGQRNQPRYSR